MKIEVINELAKANGVKYNNEMILAIKIAEAVESFVMHKAIAWLKENANKYIYNTTPSYPDADFEAKVGGKCWEDLKKYMEE